MLSEGMAQATHYVEGGAQLSTSLEERYTAQDV